MEQTNKKTATKLVEIPSKVIHKNIYEALSAFQGELKPMEKSGHVEFETRSGKLSFDYTPLGKIMETIYPILSKHGLSVRHEVSREGVEAIVTHETYKENILYSSTEKKGVDVTEIVSIEKELQKLDKTIENQIRSGIVKIGQGSDMKDTGSAITYARRYTLTMVLGISSEDDKDISLLEQSGKNAAQFAFNKVQEGLKNVKTEADLKKQTDMLKKELVTLESGKAGALGLSKEDYESLLLFAGVRAKQLKEIADDIKVESEEK